MGIKPKPRRGDRTLSYLGFLSPPPGLVHRVHQSHGSRRGLLSAAPPVLEADGFAVSRPSAAFFQTAAFCRKPLRQFLQSQRDCVLRPRVARNELPWVMAGKVFNPNGVASNSSPPSRNPVGVVGDWPSFPPSSQPWALCRNPVGIHFQRREVRHICRTQNQTRFQAPSGAENAAPTGLGN